jgi:hypothetical protein
MAYAKGPKVLGLDVSTELEELDPEYSCLTL